MTGDDAAARRYRAMRDRLDADIRRAAAEQTDLEARLRVVGRRLVELRGASSHLGSLLFDLEHPRGLLG
jgi:hypothetical protein